MNQTELIQFVTNLGANVVVRKLDPLQEEEIVCIHVDPIPVEQPGDIPGWKHALYLEELYDGWTIGSEQTDVTRPLQEPELKSLLTAWIREPDYRILQEFESD
jgi:hypothetical protein